jgi:hypothetical protein
MLNLFLIERVTKMKLGNNSVEDHPQLSQKKHPVDGALVGAGSCGPSLGHGIIIRYSLKEEKPCI